MSDKKLIRLMPLDEFEKMPPESQHSLMEAFPNTSIDNASFLCAMVDAE